MTMPALCSSSAKPHHPTKTLSRSRAQVNTSTMPSTAVTVMLAADIVSMSRCMAVCPEAMLLPENRSGIYPSGHTLTQASSQPALSASDKFSEILGKGPARNQALRSFT